MLSLQQVSDRLEIQQLFTDYATAIDTKNFDLLVKAGFSSVYECLAPAHIKTTHAGSMQKRLDGDVRP